MEIAAFENAFRSIIGHPTHHPLLAAPGAGTLANISLPQEFRTAARTLAERSGGPGQEHSILHAAAQWT